MDRIIVPVIILLVLGGAFFYLQQSTGPGRTGPMSPTSSGSGSTAKEPPIPPGEVLDRADAAIAAGQYFDGLRILSGREQDADPRTNALFGYIHVGLGNYDAAMAAFERACRDGYPEYIFALGHVSLTAGRFRKAYDIFKVLATQAPPGLFRNKALLYLGRSAEAINESAIARDAYLKLIAADPSYEEGFVQLFKIMRLDGSDAGLDKLRAAGDTRHAKSFNYHFWLAQLLFDRGKMPEALAEFKKCTELNAKNSTPFFYIYRIMRREKQIDAALADLEKYYRDNTCLPYVYFHAAKDAKATNRLDLAFKLFRTAVLLDRALLGEDDRGTFDAIKQHVTTKGSAQEKMWWPAFEAFINSEFAKARDANKIAMVQLKDELLIKDARRLERQVDEILAGQDAYSRYAAAQMLEQQARFAALRARLNSVPGKSDSATDAVKREALANPRDAKLQYRTALELARLGDSSGAKDFLRQAISSNPSVPEFYYSLARLTWSEGDARQAQEHLKQALRLSPNNTQVLSLLGAVELNAGNLRDAEEHAQTALDANPNNTDAHMVLARCYMQQEKRDEAREILKNGLAVAHDPTVTASLEALLAQVSR